MKKFFAFIMLAVFLIVLSGCDDTEVEKPEAPVAEVVPPENLPEDNSEWKNFINEISKDEITPEEIENLLSFGYEREELLKMEDWKIKRAVTAAKFGIDKNKIALADELTENPEIAENDEQFMLCGLYRTLRGEYAGDFIEAVKNEKAFSIAGIMVGYTMPYFFEISYEPDSGIEIINIWRDMVRFAKITEIYETKSFYYFTAGDGNDFYIMKEGIGDRTMNEDYVPKTDIPGMPVTAAEAEKAAEKFMAISLVNQDENIEAGAMRLFGSWGTAVKEEYYEEGITLMGEDYEAKAEGSCTVGEETCYEVRVYYQGMDIGYVYLIGAENAKTAYSVSMVNGETVPLEYIEEPVVYVEK